MTVGELLAGAAARLRTAGIESPVREARLLLGAAGGGEPASLMAWPERSVEPDTAVRFDTLLERRLRREPLSRILGHREFWSLSFAVSQATLDPRPDSETIVAAALERLDPARPSRVLDLGTGTGCLLLAILSERPLACGLGVDRSEDATRTAAENAASLDLATRAHFAVGNWVEALAGSFDVIVANPPYIPSGQIGQLDPEVRDHDPRAALDGGGDGLNAYRAIARGVSRALLNPGGYIILEVGAGQAEDVAIIFRSTGFVFEEIRNDLAGIPRAVVFRVR